MEFLFTDKGASIEALLVLICLGIMLFILAYQGYLFLRRFFAIFIKKRAQIGLESISSSIREAQEAPIPPQVTDSIIDPKIEPDKEEIENVSIPQEELTHNEVVNNEGKVNEEEIYAEYVALVDETHAEKEKQLEEQVSTEENGESEDTLDSKTNEAIDDIPSDFFDNDSLVHEKPLENETIKIEPAEDATSTEEAIDIEGTDLHLEGSQTIEDTESSTDTSSIEEEPSKEDISGESQETVIEDTVDEDSSDDKVSEVSETKEVQQVAPIDNWDSKAQDTPTPESSLPPIKNHSETLFALINTIRTVIARGQLIEARALIIQGLALDKGHRELNLMLGSLYEGERHLEKAEYVYKDLAIDYPDDIEILEKLGNVLIIEKRYSIAMEIYKKILSLGGETEGTLYILSHLCHEMNDAHEGYYYMKKYLKGWPSNPEILALISEAEIELGKRKDAIETLKRLKNLTPYNSEITTTLQKLMMEEELAGNFGGEQ